MRVTLSTPLVLDRLKRETRPYNFMFCPLLGPVIGYPAGVDRHHFTLIAPFTKRGAEWTHSEAKSLAPDGMPCGPETRGILRRASITDGDHRPILKETDRMWEHGETLSVLDPRMAEITPPRVVAEIALKAKMRACGVRPLMRKPGLSQHRWRRS